MVKKEIYRENISLRLPEISDEEFLETVYADSRRSELSRLGWSRKQEDEFFKMQFGLQKQAYQMQFPDAEYYIVELGKTRIGRIIVHHSEKEVRLVDMTLLSSFRNHGVGTFLIERMKTEADFAGKILTLRVLKTNPQAKRLYERLSLTVVEEGELHFSMQWRSL